MRINYRTPTQLGLLERFHQTLKTEELYWHLYQSPAEARERLEVFRERYDTIRPHWALQPAEGGDPLTPHGAALGDHDEPRSPCGAKASASEALQNEAVDQQSDPSVIGVERKLLNARMSRPCGTPPREEGWPLPAPKRPSDPTLPSGEFRLRLPRYLHALLTRHYQAEGVSQNTLVVALLAHGLASEPPAVIRDTTATSPSRGRSAHTVSHGVRTTGEP